jgi:hypothetical protein
MREIRRKWAAWRSNVGPYRGMIQKDFLGEMLVAHPEIRHPTSIKNAIKRWLVEMNNSMMDAGQEAPRASQT